MKTILVVDDELAVREMLQDMLSASDRQIELASNGNEANKLLASKQIDLVISDLVMPDENGIDLIMEMQKQYPDIPVIAISGGGGIEGRFDYLEIAKLVGAKDIIPKPFTADKIRSAIEVFLA